MTDLTMKQAVVLASDHEKALSERDAEIQRLRLELASRPPKPTPEETRVEKAMRVAQAAWAAYEADTFLYSVDELIRARIEEAQIKPPEERWE